LSGNLGDVVAVARRRAPFRRGGPSRTAGVVDGVSSGSGRECDAPGAHDNFPKQNGPGSPNGEEDGGAVQLRAMPKLQDVLTMH
jgi:hypothetical protein